MSEQHRAEDLRQGSRAQVGSGCVQAEASQVTHHAEQGQAVLSRAGGGVGHAPQHLSTVLQVPHLCKQAETKRLKQAGGDERSCVVAPKPPPHLEPLEPCPPAGQTGGWERADPAGTGPPRHTETARPAAPGLQNKHARAQPQRSSRPPKAAEEEEEGAHQHQPAAGRPDLQHSCPDTRQERPGLQEQPEK